MAQLATQRDIDSILKTSQQKAVSTGLFTFILVVVLMIGSFKPTIITIFETSRKLKDREIVYQKLSTHNANLTKLIQSQIELSDRFRQLNYYYPYDGDFSLFISNLNQITKKFNLSLESISFSETVNNQVDRVEVLQFEQMSPMSFQVSIKGDPADLNSFLSYLESTPYFPKILSISYSPNKTITKDTSVSLTLLLYKMNIPATIDE